MILLVSTPILLMETFPDRRADEIVLFDRFEEALQDLVMDF